MAKPGLYLDTQICIDAAKGSITPRNWNRIWRCIRQTFDYCISPLTFIELLRGLARGKSEFFQQNLEALRVLVAAGRRRFLTMPGQFVLMYVLGLSPAKPGFSPAHFEKWSKVIFKARDRRSLELGKVRFRHIFRKEFGFSFQTVTKQHEAGMEAHLNQLQALRDGELAIPPSRDRWAAVILKSLGLRPSPGECQRLGGALDAAYEYDQHLWSLVVSSNYNFAKHRTDWIDQQQLYYLADDQMHFLTGEQRIKRRAGNSPQRSRILTLDEFVSLL
jgi:hypothetical protein